MMALSLLATCAGAGAAPAFSQEAGNGVGNGVGSAIELEFWRAVTGSTDPDMYAAYLQQYPNGSFAPLARVKLNALRRPAVPPAPGAQGSAMGAGVPTVPVLPAAVSAAQTASATGPATAVPPATIPVAAPAAVPSAPAPQLAVANVPSPLPVAPAPVPAPAPAAAPVAEAARMIPAVASGPAGDVALLARLAASQETPAAVASPPVAAAVVPAVMPAAPASAASAVIAAVAAGPARADLSAGRPALVAVQSVTLPRSFCSAEERNAFHALSFRPASEAAEANNARAVAYLQGIQARYDALALGDADTRNALAAEGRAYKPIADETFAATQALVRQFDALMAVPIQACLASK